MANIITRRHFLSAGFRATALTAFAALGTVPGFVQRALAEGTIGLNGKMYDHPRLMRAKRSWRDLRRTLRAAKHRLTSDGSRKQDRTVI